MSQPSTPKHHRGLTLLEMLITLTVIATLCAFSVPSLANLLTNARTHGSNDGLIAALQFARATAVARHADIVVCPSTDQTHCDRQPWWQHGWIVFQDLDHNGTRDQNEPLIRTSPAQTQVAIASSTGREHVTYRPDGSATGTNLTLTLCDRRGSKFASSIIVNNGGRPRQGVATEEQAAVACGGLGAR